MATLDQLRSVEDRMRLLLEEAELPPPDAVEYCEAEDEITLFWDEPKVAVIIDCADAPEAPVMH